MLVDAPQDQCLVRFSWQLHHCAVHNRFLQWCDGHAPGIDDLTPVLLALRHMDRHLRRLIWPKVGQIVVVWLANAGELGPGGVQIVYQVKTSGRTVFEDAPQEGEAWSRLLAVPTQKR